MSAVTVAILAGGASRRMGRDKAGIEIDGLPLLERTARLARAVSSSVLIVGRTRPADWPLPNVSFVEDEWPGEGPLGGLAAALRRLEAPPLFGASGADRPYGVLLLACDQPALTPEALTWLREAAQECSQALVDGLVTVNGGQREPLFSVYTPHCLPRIEAHVTHGRRSLKALIDAGNFQFADLPPTLIPALVNVNTPDDLAAWRQSGTRRP